MQVYSITNLLHKYWSTTKSGLYSIFGLLEGQSVFLNRGCIVLKDHSLHAKARRHTQSLFGNSVRILPAQCECKLTQIHLAKWESYLEQNSNKKLFCSTNLNLPQFNIKIPYFSAFFVVKSTNHVSAHNLIFICVLKKQFGKLWWRLWKLNSNSNIPISTSPTRNNCYPYLEIIILFKFRSSQQHLPKNM